MRAIDQARSKVNWERERAKKFKRLTILFFIIDILIIIKLIYNWLIGPYWDNYAIAIFWLAILIAAAGVSGYLSFKLWLYEREKKQQLKAIAEAKKNILQQEKDKGLF